MLAKPPLLRVVGELLVVQTAKDKAVEILKSFNEKRKEGKVKSKKPKLKRIPIRFDKRCYSFAKTTNQVWKEIAEIH